MALVDETSTKVIADRAIALAIVGREGGGKRKSWPKLKRIARITASS